MVSNHGTKKNRLCNLERGMMNILYDSGNTLQELDYYDKLFRWYVVNTSKGWSPHLIIEKSAISLKFADKKCGHLTSKDI